MSSIHTQSCCDTYTTQRAKLTEAVPAEAMGFQADHTLPPLCSKQGDHIITLATVYVAMNPVITSIRALVAY